MRTQVVAVVVPRLDDPTRLAQADEQVFVEAFTAQPRIFAAKYCRLEHGVGDHNDPAHPLPLA